MRPTYRLVPDFIIPSLNRSTYGVHLHWENRENGSFKISRIHQSSEMWNEQCIEVYKAWSLKKKLWNTSDPKRITKAKHRLITALRRNPEIEMLKKESTFYRFRLAHQNFSDEREGYEMPSKELELSTITRNGEYAKHIKHEVENCEIQSDNENKRQQTDFSQTNNCETNTSLVCKPAFQLELSDVQKVFPMPENIFNDNFCSDEGNSSGFSDRCCCEILLDKDNYLCNQKCIWHGMPP